MGKSGLGWRWSVFSGVLLGILGIEAAVAQPISDETLGGERSQVIDRGGSNFDIDGGAQRGGNLFHSFREFNVNDGGSVYFVNPVGINNILSRVTGNNPSNILGILGVRGPANLFLINPNGILFGPNSSLDVQGSFAATTTDAIEFGEQGFFSATNPETPSLLTVNPSAFFFNQLPRGDIESRSITPDRLQPNLLGLRVPNGEQLLLLGGNVSIDGGGREQRAGLHTPGGRVEIGSVAGIGRIGLNLDGSLTIPDAVARGDVIVQDRGFVNVRRNGGGTIAITANNIRVTGASELLSGILQNQGMPESQAGDIILNATGVLQIQQSSRVANQLGVNATGNTGNVIIRAGSLVVTRGGRIATLILGNGEAGSVLITAGNEVRFQGRNNSGQGSGALSVVGGTGIGRSGNVEITSPILEMLNGAELNSRTEGRGNAGNVILTATDRIRFDNNVNVSSTVTEMAIGQGGNIEITTPILEVLGGSELNASTVGQGNAGNVIITAGERVRFQGRLAGEQVVPRGGALSRVTQTGVGQGGNIRITAPILEVLDGARLSANTVGQGNAGNVILIATDRIRFEGISELEPADRDRLETRGGAFSTIETRRGQTIDLTRQGGNVEITTPVLEVFNGAQLQTSTDGRGNAGNVILTATDRIRFEGRSGMFASAALSTVERGGIGQGGNIRIETPILEVLNGARLNATTVGQGDAGNIFILADDRVRFQGSSSATVNTPLNQRFSGAFSRVGESGNGQGGNIRINAPILEVLDGARLSVNTQGRGNAGNIFIRASDRVRFQGVIPDGEFGGALSRVEEGGNGESGSIRITTSILEVLEGAQIQTSTNGRGNAGSILIRANDRVRFAGRIREFPSGAYSLVESAGNGQGGSIRITAPIIEMLNGARFNANTEGQGNAGSVIIRADDRVILDGVSQDRFSTAIFTTTQETARGQGGTVEVTAPRIRIANGAVINAGTENSQRGGSITINADAIEVINSGQIITTTGGKGQAGNITLNADQIQLSGRYPDTVRQSAILPLEDEGESGLFASTRPNSTGNGGRITVNSTNLTLQESARISAQSQGEGMAGDIQLNALEQLQLINSDIITNAPRSSGGDIEVNTAAGYGAGLIILRGDSDITTNSQGNGGNITLRGSGIIAFDDSDILARSQDARGGNITLDAFFSQNAALDSEIPFDGNDRVDVNADGQIAAGTITTPDTSVIQNSLTELPDTAIDTDALLANSCVVRSQEETGTFTITGPGGLPQRPGSMAPSTYPTAPVQSIPEDAGDRSWQPGDPIVEPQGAYALEDGRVVLSRECR